MPRHCLGTTLSAALCVFCFAAGSALAVPPSQKLLPNTTKGYVSFPDAKTFREQWNKTQIGQLLADPEMKPFADDLRRQISKKFEQTRARLGVTWEDLKTVPGGEVCFAAIQPAADESAIVMIVDVTGHAEETGALLAKISAKLIADGAKKSVVDVGDDKITRFDLPEPEGDRPRQFSFNFVKDNLLVVGNHEKVVRDMLHNFDKSSKTRLDDVEAYRKIMQRCALEADGLKPNVRWFVEPFGLLEMIRVANDRDTPARRANMVQVFKNQGFAAVRGIGGFVNFSTDRYEILHRTMVYAPRDPGAEAGEKYRLAARMLHFPAGLDLEPHEWIPREIATHTTFMWDTHKAFKAVGTLVDEMVGDEGVWDEILTGLRDDELGAQIDVEKDVIGNMGQRITVVTDYVQPIHPKSERLLFAVESTNPKALAKTIHDAMQDDPRAKKHIVGDVVVWEIVEENELLRPAEVNIPQLGGGQVPDLRDGAKRKGDREEEKRKLPNSAVTVVHGHMMIASHFDFLKKIVVGSPRHKTLRDLTEYRTVHAELDRLIGSKGTGVPSVRTFSLTDEEYRPTYELLKAGKMPESETLLGQLLNRIFSEGKDDVVRKQKVDASKLPNYDMVRRYLGPAGTAVLSEDDGWLVVGFSVSKQQQQNLAQIPVKKDEMKE